MHQATPSLPNRILRITAALGLIATTIVWTAPPAEAAVAFRSAATAGGYIADGGTLDVPVPAGVVAGDLLIAQIGYNADAGSTITPSAGWNVISVTDNANHPIMQGLYWREATGSEPAQYSFTLTSGKTDTAAGAIAAYSGVDTTNPIDAFAGQANGTSTSIVAPSITTTQPGTALIAFFAVRDDNPLTPAASMTERWDVDSAGGVGAIGETAAEAADEYVAGVGATGTRTATAAASDGSIGHLVALAPAPVAIAPVAVWRRSGQNTPLYNEWNGAAFTGTTLSQGVGEWKVIQGAEAPSRHEAIVLGVDGGSGDVTGEMWTGSGWAPLTINPLGTMSQTYWWGFDVAYEPVSGDAVVVSTDGGSLKSWVWNGSGWTGPTTLTLPIAGTPRHLQLAAHPYADEMVLIVSNSNSQEYAFAWDGSAWGNSITLSSGTGGDRTDIYVAYEQQLGRALIVYGKGTDNVYYRHWSGSWGPESVVNGIGGGYARWLTLGADPSSNNIAMGVLTNDNDVWLSMWTGSGWINQRTVTTSSTGTTEPAVAVAFEGTSGQALATYGESSNTPRYRTWTSGSGWDATEQSLPSIGGVPNSQMLYPEPGTDGIMLGVNDDSNDIHYLYWNGNSWGSDNELETNSGDTKNQPFLFLWNGATGSPPSNSAPSDIGLVPASVVENLAVGTVVGTLSTTDPDPGDSHTYSLVVGVGDGDNGLFTIVGDELRTAAALDYETLGTPLSIRVQTQDDGTGTLTYQEALTVTLTDQNEAPSDIGLVPASVVENVAVGTVVGTLSTTDPDPGDSHTYSLVVGVGDGDNGLFTIVGDELRTAAALDYETLGTPLSIRVQTQDDGTGTLTYQEALTVTLTDQNEAPVANDDAAGAAEDGLVVVNVKVNDTDVEDGIPAGPAAVVTQPLHGSAVANAGGMGTVTYTPDPDYFGPDSFTYTIDDSGGATSNVATVSINVSGSDDPPIGADDGPFPVLEDGTLVVGAQGQQFSLTWGTNGSGNGQFGAQRGIAVADDGSLYVVDTSNHRVQKFDAGGNYLLQWGSNGTGNGQFDTPMGVAVASDGTVFISDLFNDRIQYFDSAGTYLGQFGSTGTGNGQLDSPRGIDFGPDGNLYVADAYNYRIQVFSPAGAYLRQWGSSGTGNGQFNAPRDLAVDAVGDVYVADSFNDRMQKFDSVGTYLLQWGASGTADGEFNFPRGIDIDAAGDVFVTDSFNDRVQVFDNTGVFLGKFGTSGTGNGQFNATYGLAFGPGGDLYVGDIGNSRVQRFTPIGILANDSDPDHPLDTLTATVDTDVTNGVLVLSPDGTFTYDPDPDYFGPDGFVYRVCDTSAACDTATVTLTVGPVNDEPSFNRSGNIGLGEDNGSVTVAGWANSMSAGPANESGQILTFNVTGNTNPSLFAVAPTLDATTGDLTFTPADDAFGSAVVTVELQDNGGTADGGDDTSPPESFTISINSKNDAPSFTAGGNVSVDEDSGAYSAVWATAMSPGPANESAQSLTFNVTGNTNPGLFAVAPAVDAATGQLTFTPAANANGAASITVELQDDGGTGSGGVDTSAPEVFTITVDAVNDAPSFVAGGNVAVDEDSGAYSAPWASSISAGPANESGQAVTFNVTGNTNPGLFSVLPAVDSSGNLTFTTSADANGVASITIEAQDNGGTGNGGDDTSPAVVFTITLNSLNDAPVLNLVGAQSGDEGTLITFAATAGDSDVPADSLTFTLEDGAGAVPAGAVITAGGVFTFTPSEAQGPGVFSFDVVVTDDGAGLLSDRETITVTVTEVNVAPVLDAVGAQSGDEGTVITFTATATDTDLPANSLTFTLEDGAGSVPSGAVITAGGVFTFTPTEAQGPGVYTFDVVVTDNTLLEDRETITVTVTEVNTAPVLDAVGAQAGDEGTLITFTATASDSDVPGSVTFTLEGGAGAVPAGAGITAGGAFTWIPSEAQGPGVFSFDVVVTDNTLLEDRETITVTVNEVNTAPVLDPVGAQSGAEGTLITFAASASDVDVPADTLMFTLEDGAGSVPSGASITAGGVFTFTPSEAQGPGVFSFDVVVTDDGTGLLSDRETITVTVTEVNTAPVLDPVGAQSGDEGTLITFAASASDVDAPANTLTFTLEDGAGSVPSGAVITAGGVFNWTPSEAQGPGVFSFDVVVTDDGSPNLEDRETITVTVDQANSAPVLDPVGAQSGDEETLITFGATASDVDIPVDALVFTLEDGAGSVPAGASITTGGAFTFIPSESQGPGAYSFDVVVTDDGAGLLSDRETITVTVTEVNTAPVLDAVGAQSGDEGTLITFAASASDVDVPADTLMFTLEDGAGAVPAGAVITAGGVFTFTPSEAQGPGVFSFDVVVTDNTLLEDRETITVTVNEVNTAPVLDPVGAQSGAEGTLITFAATAGDSDVPADSLTFTLEDGAGAVPAGAVITAGGVFAFTPSEAQGPGAYSFDVVVTDDGAGLLSDRETITVTVTEVNVAPVLDAVGAQSGDEGTLISFTASAADADIPADTLTFTLEDGAGSVPAGASITAGGVFTFTPSEAQGPGVFSFDVVVTDNTLLEDRETITVTVTEANIAPVLDSVGARSGDEGTLIGFTATATDSDVPSNSLTFTLEDGAGSVPPGASITAAGVFTWTPTEVQGPGAYSFDVVVTDDGAGSLTDRETITVTVNEVNVAPVLDPVGAQSGDEGTLITFAATASDSDVPGSIIFSLEDGSGLVPAGASITAGGVFSWIPTEVQGPGVFSFDVVVTDNTLLEDRETITVTVNEVNQAPVLDPVGPATGGEGTLITFTATGSDTDLPSNGLTFSLENGAGSVPSGAVITTGGVFTFTPSESQGPGVYSFDVVVTDDGAGLLEDRETIAVTVTEVETAPVLDPVGPQSGDEGTLIGFTATATDSDVPAETLTFTLEDGAGSIPAGAVITGGGAFTWTPTESQGPGVYSFDVVVTDDGTGSLTDRETITVTINEANIAPVLDPVGAQSGDEGTLIGFTATASDVDVPANGLTFTLEDGAGSVPAGAVITAGGVFTWAPSEAQGPGVFSFDVVVTDDGAGLLEDRETITVTVAEVNVAPVLDAVGAQSGDEGALITFTASASDVDVPADTLTFTLEDGAGSVPAGASITAGGVFTWTPTEVQGPGVFSFDVVVTDDTLLEDRETISVTVNEVSVAPVLGPVGPQSGDEGTLITFTATASDSDVPGSVTFTLEDGAGAVPAGAGITTGGAFTWIPTESQGPGVYSFDVVVTDNTLLEDRETITVTVNEVNTAPVLNVVGSQSGDEGTLISFTASASDADVPADTLTFTLEDGAGSVPVGASITAGGVFTFTPSESQGPGVYSFDVVVTDDGVGLLEDRETITVTVNEINQAPVIVDPGDQMGGEGLTTTLVLVGSDSDVPVNALVWSATGLPAGLSIDPVTGLVSGVVALGAAADSPFSVTVELADDGAPASTGSVSFDWVIGVNTAPVTAPDFYEVEPGGSLIVGVPGVLGNDVDPDGDALVATVVVPPSAGTFSLSPAGGFTYSHNGGGTVEDVFVYQADDGRGGLTLATVKVSIIEPNLPPILNSDFLTLLEDGFGSLSPLANDSDPNGDPLSLVSFDQPGVGLLSAGADGGLLFTPPADFFGEVTASYTASDGQGGVATGTVTFMVEPVNDLPVGQLDVATLGAYLPFTLDVLSNDSDVEGDVLRVSSVLGASVGEVGLNPDGTITYRPAVGFVGTDTFQYVLSDGAGGLDTVTVRITVPVEVLSVAIARGDAIGSPTLGFQAPEADLSEGPTITFGLTQGVSLLADAFFQSLGALQLPILFLGLALGTVLVLGGFTELPMLLAGRRRRFYSVVLLDREHRLAARSEPGADESAVYFYEPTAAGFQSLDKPRREGGRTWIPVESPNGAGWVEMSYLTETVDLQYFLDDARPVTMLKQLARDLIGNGSITGLFSERGLAVALSNEPQLIPFNELHTALTNREATDSRQLWDDVLEPLGAALRAADDLDTRSSHSRNALIPVELWNFQYLTVTADGHPPWLVYFEYQKGKPKIVGIGIDR